MSISVRTEAYFVTKTVLVDVYDIDITISVAVRLEGDALAVRRPSGSVVGDGVLSRRDRIVQGLCVELSIAF